METMQPITIIDMDNNNTVIVYITAPSLCPIKLHDQIAAYANMLGMEHWEVNQGEYYTTSEL